jgi:hypothetical protein
MGHETHRPGTVTACLDCTTIAYEPGWYAALAAFVDDDFAVIENGSVISLPM